MRVLNLQVKNFRGIRELDWTIRSRVSCLIGPGDSGKSTILDAIDLVLSARWNHPISDMDFHKGDTNDPIVIEATLGELPESLMRDDKFGLELRGWDPTNGLVDEPAEGVEPVLTIRFSVDKSLEPSWKIVNGRLPEGVPISAKDRERFGSSRLGFDIDRHLAWSKGSALYRMTDDPDEVPRTLAAANRAAREAAKTTTFPKAVQDAAKAAHQAAVEIGARPTTAFIPLVGSGTGVTQGSLELFDDDVPVRAGGLGSRRLAALGIQIRSVPNGAILLVDEVESGLEPHRLARVLSVLDSRTVSEAAASDSADLREGRRSDRTSRTGQVFLTTHSPVVLRELVASDLCVVRLDGGKSQVASVPIELQDLVRAAPEALLATRVLICEGNTEAGLCRALEPTWRAEQNGAPLAHRGADIVTGFSGGGTKAPAYALKLASLGYPTALLADSDKPLSPSRLELEGLGVTVIQWDGEMATEARIVTDLPLPSVQALIDLAVDYFGEDIVLAALNREAKSERASLALPSLSLRDWTAAGVTESLSRSLIARAATKNVDNRKAGNSWFKTIDRGRDLGAIVAAALPGIPSSDLAQKLRSVSAWLYG